MTLDPVHVEGIARLARRLRPQIDEREQADLAERAWEAFLDPLYDDAGEVVLESIGDHTRRSVDMTDIALSDPPFRTQHGLDAGTINPTTFKNGLVLDVSQAAMASVPSDVELHRGRTIVMTVHSNDETVALGGDDWRIDDQGYARRRVLHAPQVDRYEQTVVHALALYRAESEHAIEQAPIVDDVLFLDGPIYPTGLLKWIDRDPELKRLVIEEQEFLTVIENYYRLVERFAEQRVALVGFVKHSSSRAISRELGRQLPTPWANDEGFFRTILERRDEEGELVTDALTFTPWFRSRVGTHGTVTDGTLSLEFDRSLDPSAYEVTFFVVYDPRTDLVYRIEAPAVLTDRAADRDRIRDQVLLEIARERGPPLAIRKADELARIDRQGKETLRRRIEREFDTDRQRTYNQKRWGAIEEVDGIAGLERT